MTEDIICKIQCVLGFEETGVLDPHTKAGIKNFQTKLGLPATGDIDEKTLNSFEKRYGLTLMETIPAPGESVESDVTTDLFETDSAFDIQTHMLSRDEYVRDYGKIYKRRHIFLHHTAGWNNPIKTVNDWENDNRGRLGTHYVIGGSNFRTGDTEFDGMIVKCIPDEWFAWHLGSTKTHGINFDMHKTSIGIEICNFGYLTEKNGKYYTYTGQTVPDEYVCDLGFKFRGYQYWHKYTDAQINSLEYLLKLLSRQYSINLSKGLASRLMTMSANDAFEYSKSAVSGKIIGILSHTNVRKDKFDVFPQKELVDMLKKFK